jgi:ABC-type uncharacterized transport system permease subunit
MCNYSLLSNHGIRIVMPYLGNLVSIIALAGFIGNTRPPKAIGKPYSEEEE